MEPGGTLALLKSLWKIRLKFVKKTSMPNPAKKVRHSKYSHLISTKYFKSLSCQTEWIYASPISKIASLHKSNKVFLWQKTKILALLVFIHVCLARTAFLFQELGVLKFDQLIEFQILKIVLQFSNKIVPC